MTDYRAELAQMAVGDIDKINFPREWPGGRIYDHEIYITFNNDGDGEMFMEWWYDIGKGQFLEYLKAYTDES